MDAKVALDEQDERVLELALQAANAGFGIIHSLHRAGLLGDDLALEELRRARLKMYAAARYLDAIIGDLADE